MSVIEWAKRSSRSFALIRSHYVTLRGLLNCLRDQCRSGFRDDRGSLMIALLSDA